MKRIGFAVVAIAAVLARTGFAQQACVAADSSCKESFAVGQFSFWYYRSFPLQTPNANITRAVIVMHGMNRNASDSFQAVVTALNNAGDPALLVIAPHFKGSAPNSPACNDSLEPNELHWSCTGQDSINRWDDGGQALDAGGDVIYSFAMIDKLLDTLNDASRFPNLRKIAVTGHSEGGEFTQRYAAGNLKDGAISPSVKYLIANPGSYMYLDNSRLPKGETCLEDGTCTAQLTASPDLAACPDSYNSYKYGLDNRSYGYMSSDQPGFTDGEVRARFLSRTVALLTGANDQSDDSLFDTSCPAAAQGGHLAGDGSGLIGGRRERGIVFWNYTRQLGAAHTLTLVPGCGHDETCMYSAAQTIQAINGGGSSSIAPTPSEISAWSAAGTYTTGTVGLLHTMGYSVRDTAGGTVTNTNKSDGFSANFNRLSGADIARTLPTAERLIPTAGRCTITTPSATPNPSPTVSIRYLDAGPSISSSGPNGTQVAVKTVLPTQLVYVANNIPGITPGRYTFRGQGGPDVGAFSGTLDLAPELVWTNPGDAKVVTRANGLLVQWSGGDPNELVTIAGSSFTSATNVSSFFCSANNSAGQFTVPASILNQLPASQVVTVGQNSALIRGTVNVFTTSQTRLTAPGMDYLVGSGEWSTTVTAQYK